MDLVAQAYGKLEDEASQGHQGQHDSLIAVWCQALERLPSLSFYAPRHVNMSEPELQAREAAEEELLALFPGRLPTACDPEWIKGVSKDDAAFLAGVMDGDGCFAGGRLSTGLSFKNVDLLLAFVRICGPGYSFSLVAFNPAVPNRQGMAKVTYSSEATRHILLELEKKGMCLTGLLQFKHEQARALMSDRPVGQRVQAQAAALTDGKRNAATVVNSAEISLPWLHGFFDSEGYSSVAGGKAIIEIAAVCGALFPAARALLAGLPLSPNNLRRPSNT